MFVPDELIERFLATGRLPRAWPDWEGEPAARRQAAEAAVREVLGRIVRWRARKAPLSVGAAPADPGAIVVARARPMVEGLFPAAEAPSVLAYLPTCVRVVTPEAYPELIAALSPSAAWDLANLLLDAMGAPPLADDTPELEGLSHACLGYVLPAAFLPEADTDVLVHEIAHLLHSVPRGKVGLRPAQKPLLHVPTASHELFAYACEAWSRLCTEADPRAAVALRRVGPPPVDARVDRAELDRVLTEAAEGASWAAIRRLAD